MLSYWITIDGLNLHYVRQGDGPPALLIHGYGHTHEMWARPVRAYLQDHYCCYLLDLPGHGQSDKPPLEWYNLDNYTNTLDEFCRQLRLDRLLLIGYSMGGLMTINLALRHPTWITNLVTINAPIRGGFLTGLDPLLRLTWLSRFHFNEFLLKVYTSVYPLALPVELQRYAHVKMLFSRSARRVQRQIAQSTVESLFGDYRMVRRTDLSDQIKWLKPSTLVIVSERDQVVPPEHGRLLSQQAAKAELALIPRSGHLPLDEQPELFDAALQNYLKIRTDASLEP